jgi:hypothetical protein
LRRIIVLSLVVSSSWPIHQLDVKNTFLHGTFNETVYCQQPSGFENLSSPDLVCLLHISLYGLKQAHRAWFHCFATIIQTLGFSPSNGFVWFLATLCQAKVWLPQFSWYVFGFATLWLVIFYSQCGLFVIELLVLPKFEFIFLSHTFCGCHTFMASHTLPWQNMARNQTPLNLNPPCLFFVTRPHCLSSPLYDDIILNVSSNSFLHHIISSLNRECSMTDFGPLHHFLGVAVSRTSTTLFLS